MFNIEVVTSDKSLDCGPTCLKMLLSYYDINIPLDVLVNQCGIKLNGVTVKDLKRVAEIYGIDLHAYGDSDKEGERGVTIEEIFEADRPAIVHWCYNHFVVYCGLDEDGKVVIINPDRGRVRISKGTFKCLFSHVSLWNGEPKNYEKIYSYQ